MGPGRRFRDGAVGVALVLVLVACAGGATDAPDPADFSEIAVGEPVMTADPTGTSAILTVSTSVEAVCAVAFGETERLGSLATDQDMGGRGHSEHNAVLTELTPDTDYFYRLQGVGPDGRLYQSELFRFRTPVAAAAEAPGESVAVGSNVIDVSSEFSDAFAAGNAVDGNPATEWSSAGDGDDAYIVIDLGRVVQVVAVAFRTRSMGDGTATTETFTVTVDGGTTYGPFGTGVASVGFEGRVVRFDVHTSTGGNTGAAEVAVYAGP